MLFINNARVRDQHGVRRDLRPVPRSCRWCRSRAGSAGSRSSSRRWTTSCSRTRPQQCAALAKKPSEYFRSNWYATFWFEENQGDVQGLLDKVGDDRVLFETDFPHPTCLYPSPLDIGRREDGRAAPGEPAPRHGRERGTPLPRLSVSRARPVRARR